MSEMLHMDQRGIHRKKARSPRLTSSLRVAILCSAVMTTEGFSVGDVLDLCSLVVSAEETKFDLSPDLQAQLDVFTERHEVLSVVDEHVGLKSAGEKPPCMGQAEAVSSSFEGVGQGKLIAREMEDIGQDIIASAIEGIRAVTEISDAEAVHGLEALALLLMFVALIALAFVAFGGATDDQRPREIETGMSCKTRTKHQTPTESETGMGCSATASDHMPNEKVTGRSHDVRAHDLIPDDSETSNKCAARTHDHVSEASASGTSCAAQMPHEDEIRTSCSASAHERMPDEGEADIQTCTETMHSVMEHPHIDPSARNARALAEAEPQCQLEQSECGDSSDTMIHASESSSDTMIHASESAMISVEADQVARCSGSGGVTGEGFESGPDELLQEEQLLPHASAEKDELLCSVETGFAQEEEEEESRSGAKLASQEEQPLPHASAKKDELLCSVETGFAQEEEEEESRSGAKLASTSGGIARLFQKSVLGAQLIPFSVVMDNPDTEQTSTKALLGRALQLQDQLGAPASCSSLCRNTEQTSAKALLAPALWLQDQLGGPASSSSVCQNTDQTSKLLRDTPLAYWEPVTKTGSLGMALGKISTPARSTGRLAKHNVSFTTPSRSNPRTSSLRGELNAAGHRKSTKDRENCHQWQGAEVCQPLMDF
eukprot:TRINITY_DN1089_c0_g1_i1.p1 TRINITY_DN1089_c0_g1~~TRINITY_DN1089_c0_g1_i1.p1  ORF type:complete len:661 (+),score=121.92 TRINITY_DN1089_c0_g1_i1:50-2032(+)